MTYVEGAGYRVPYDVDLFPLQVGYLVLFFQSTVLAEAAKLWQFEDINRYA